MRLRELAVVTFVVTPALFATACGGDPSGPSGPDAGGIDAATNDAPVLRETDAAPPPACPAPEQAPVFIAMGERTWTCTSPEITDSVTCTWKNPAMLPDGHGHNYCVSVCKEPAGINCMADSFVLSADLQQLNCHSLAGVAFTCRPPRT
jgi:hypothetical protein